MVREVLAHQLGREAGKVTAFDALDPRFSQMPGTDGLGEDEWDLLRAVPGLTASEGRPCTTPRDRGLITDKTDPETAADLVRRFTTGVKDVAEAA